MSVLQSVILQELELIKSKLETALTDINEEIINVDNYDEYNNTYASDIVEINVAVTKLLIRIDSL